MSTFEYYMLSLVDVTIFMIKHPLVTKKFMFSRDRNIRDYLLKLSRQYEKAGHKINRYPPHMQKNIHISSEVLRDFVDSN